MRFWIIATTIAVAALVTLVAWREVRLSRKIEALHQDREQWIAERQSLNERAGKQDALAEEFFKAHFLEGANLTDRDTLADVAARAGLDRAAVAAYLDADADRAVIEQADVEARSAGIGGVPFFIFNRRVGVSGAQDPEALLAAMEQAVEERQT
jgi:predicted DsbA family dithiol-disulfide isomerase